MTRLWKVMATLIEYYGFERDDSTCMGDHNCKDTYIFEDDSITVTVLVYYDGKDMCIDDMWITITREEETVYDDSLDSYDIANLSDFLDQLYKDFEIN